MVSTKNNQDPLVCSVLYISSKSITYFIFLQILEVSPPSMEYVSDSEGSDSDDSSLLSEDEPLIMAVQSAPNTNQSNLLTTPSVPAQERHPRADSPSSLGNFSEDVGVDLMNGTVMLRRAMSSLEETNDVSC